MTDATDATTPDPVVPAEVSEPDPSTEALVNDATITTRADTLLDIYRFLRREGFTGAAAELRRHYDIPT